MAYENHAWQTGELISAESLNNINDALVRASSGIMAQYTAATQTISGTTEFLVYLNTARYKTGEGFEMTTNGVTCKLAGMVAVRARIFCASDFTAGDQVLLVIGKNSDTVVCGSHKMQSTGKEHIVCETVLVPVEAGDVLKLKCHNVTSAAGVIGNSATKYANSLTAHYLA